MLTAVSTWMEDHIQWNVSGFVASLGAWEGPECTISSGSVSFGWDMIAGGHVSCVMHVKEPRTLIVKEKGLAPVFLEWQQDAAELLGKKKRYINDSISLIGLTCVFTHGANFMELLSRKMCLAYLFGYQPNCHTKWRVVCFILLSKNSLLSSSMWKWTPGVFVGNSLWYENFKLVFSRPFDILIEQSSWFF